MKVKNLVKHKLLLYSDRLVFNNQFPRISQPYSQQCLTRFKRIPEPLDQKL